MSLALRAGEGVGAAPGGAELLAACDAGGTRIKIGLVRAGRVVVRREVEARSAEGFGQALERIARVVGACCREVGVPPGRLSGFGLSFPGIIEPGTGRILSSPAGKFDDAGSIDVPGWIRERMGLPVRVCNDANAALAGEWSFGAARGTRSVVMLTLGTGIGTSVIIDGQPLRGQHGQAGCLGGHWVSSVAGRPCPCGNAGCAETEASTWALPGLAREDPGFGESALSGARPLDYAAVFLAAAAGDRLGLALRDRAIRVWGGVVVSLIHAYDPELVVVGGGILRSGPLILSRFRRQVARHAWTPWGRVRICAAGLGDDAALLGVAALFGQREGAQA